MAPDRTDRQFSPREITAYLTVVMNLAALVWGAATLKVTVDNLIIRLDKMEVATTGFAQLQSQAAVMNYRLCLLETLPAQRGSCHQ